MASTSLGQPPLPPQFFIQSFDRRTHEAYLRNRATSYLQKQYRLLLQTPEGEEFPPVIPNLSNKRARPDSAEEGGEGKDSNGAALEDGTDPSKRAKLGVPHIDSTYLLDLTTAKPEAGVLALGDAPNDVYLPSLPKTKRDDHRALIGALIDRSMESDTLFWDLKRLNHEQVRALAELEWSRQIPSSTSGGAGATVPGNAAGPGGAGSTRSSRRQQQQLVSEEEKEVDEDIAAIRRAFCDKTRAQALASRAAAGW